MYKSILNTTIADCGNPKNIIYDSERMEPAFKEIRETITDHSLSLPEFMFIVNTVTEEMVTGISYHVHDCGETD